MSFAYVAKKLLHIGCLYLGIAVMIEFNADHRLVNNAYLVYVLVLELYISTTFFAARCDV